MYWYVVVKNGYTITSKPPKEQLQAGEQGSFEESIMHAARLTLLRKNSICYHQIFEILLRACYCESYP